MKSCEKSARFVVIDDPNNSNPFCKEHGPEKMLKKMGVLYRRARGGERCGQNVDGETNPVKSAKAWSKSGDDTKPYQAFKGGFSGSNTKQSKKIGKTYKVRLPKKK